MATCHIENSDETVWCLRSVESVMEPGLGLIRLKPIQI